MRLLEVLVKVLSLVFMNCFLVLFRNVNNVVKEFEGENFG